MRTADDWTSLLRFGLVGASGVVVNMAVMVLLTLTGPSPEGSLWGLGLRWYHVFSVAAFLVANVWNFQLNRTWTFRSTGRWAREYLSFLGVGGVVQVLGLGLLTLLMHPGSAVALPRSVFDDSSFLLTRVYWAQLVTIAVVTPASFLLNRLWVFRRDESGE